ncbi:MAG TPA: hypothetical protein VMA09_10380 [Candidatus Binataceae bacterium]|nr:hypothetical protein [Candidatus Binataceae bacterium]
MKTLGIIIVLAGVMLCGVTVLLAARATGENQVASVAVSLASIGTVMAGAVVIWAARGGIDRPRSA